MDELKVALCDLGPDDYEQVLAVWRDAGLRIRPEGRDAPDAFARQMAAGRQRVIGLRTLAGGPNEATPSEPGVLVAVAVLTHDGRKGWINRLAVVPAYRHYGLASRLIAEAERWFGEEVGLEVFAALIEKENHASRALFKSAGYGQLDIVYVTKRLRPDA